MLIPSTMNQNSLQTQKLRYRHLVPVARMKRVSLAQTKKTTPAGPAEADCSLYRLFHNAKPRKYVVYLKLKIRATTFISSQHQRWANSLPFESWWDRFSNTRYPLNFSLVDGTPLQWKIISGVQLCHHAEVKEMWHTFNEKYSPPTLRNSRLRVVGSAVDEFDTHSVDNICQLL